MKKFLIAAGLATLVTAGAGLGVAQATKPADAGPGPNGHNEHGLCTAYFNGQKNGHADGSPGPFAALEQDGTTYDGSHGSGNEDAQHDELDVSDDVFEYCSDSDINPKGISGNPDDNGRWDCNDDTSGAPRDTDGDQELECIANA